MLHPIPDSTERARLFEVVDLQQRLIEALCALPQGAQVDETWLQTIWHRLPAEWVERFWENDSGKRSQCIETIAAASLSDKQTVQEMMEAQLRFAELYSNPPTVRLTDFDWDNQALAAAKSLLLSFYDPYFYEREGYQKTGEHKFHKDIFIAGFTPKVKICPYTDNIIQDTKLDHFIPKDQYPMLSCHPDNLIPCSTDPNSVGRKGSTPPLDPAEQDQANAWFHPRLRNAVGRYRLSFPAGASPQPQVNFEALNSDDQPRLDNMERIFGLNEFWGGFLDDEVQLVATIVEGDLREENIPVTEENVREKVRRLARQEQARIGRDGLAIAKSFFYEHIAQTQYLLDQVVRTCSQGT